jgi:hypothetical protein
MRKNTVEAIIEIEMIQKEMATGSLGLRKPRRSSGIVAEAMGRA